MSDPFANDVLERLVRSNQHYQRSHGHYIVPLAERLLEARQQVAALQLAINAERHNRLKDNTYLLKRAEAAEQQVAALREALEPFTRYDLHALQHIVGLEHDGHALRAIHAEDADALIEHIANARSVLGLPGRTWTGQALPSAPDGAE